jgi:hypothetical protein
MKGIIFTSIYKKQNKNKETGTSKRNIGNKK